MLLVLLQRKNYYKLLFLRVLSFQLRALKQMRKCRIICEATHFTRTVAAKDSGRLRANAISSDVSSKQTAQRDKVVSLRTSQVRPGSCHLAKLVLTTGKINRHSEIRILCFCLPTNVSLLPFLSRQISKDANELKDQARLILLLHELDWRLTRKTGNGSKLTRFPSGVSLIH